MIKLCAIGCGGHASDTHGPSQQRLAQRHPDVMLAACCDVNEASAIRYRDRFGFARHYDNINTMLEREQPDALSLVLPTHVTCQMAMPLLQRGTPLFLEKPPGLTIGELEQLISAAEVGGGLQQVAFNRRYMPLLQRARSILNRIEEPGLPLRITYTMTRNGRLDEDFATTAIHAIDAALFLADSPYSRVDISFREFPWMGKGVAAYVLNATCENGTEIHMNIHPVAGETSETITVHGLDLSLRLDLLGHGASFSGSLEHWRGNRLIERFVPDGDRIERCGVYPETVAFLEAVRTGAPCFPSLEDCRQQIALMEAIRLRKPSVLFPRLAEEALQPGL